MSSTTAHPQALKQAVLTFDPVHAVTTHVSQRTVAIFAWLYTILGMLLQVPLFPFKVISAATYYFKESASRAELHKEKNRAKHELAPEDVKPPIEDLRQPDNDGRVSPVGVAGWFAAFFSESLLYKPSDWPIALAAGLINAGGARLNWTLRHITRSAELSLVNILQPDFRLDSLFSRVTFQKDLKGADAPNPRQPKITPKDVLCGLVSKLMYEDHTYTRERAKEWGFDHFVDLSYNSANVRLVGLYYFNTRATILRIDSSVIVAFRGTQPTSLAQWLTDGAVHMLPFPGYEEAKIKVHRGFMAALGLRELNNVSTSPTDVPMFTQIVRLLHRLTKMPNGVTNVYITGHSLGAALANLFAYSVRALANPNNAFIQDANLKTQVQSVSALVSGVYTYGTPRQGDAKYAEDYNHEFRGTATHHLINNSDIVCRVPPATQIFFPYVHTKGARYVVTSPDLRSTLAYAEDDAARQQDPDVGHVPLQISIKALLDHFPDDYVRHLDDVLTKQT